MAKATRYTIARNIPRGACIRMHKEKQVKSTPDRWEVLQEEEATISREVFENMAGDATEKWFNDFFGEGTFSREWVDNHTLRVVNICPDRMYRTVQVFEVI